MATFDTIISGGLIVDGTGSPAFYGDVGILGGRVAAVGDLSPHDCGRLIEAEGRVVASGFISYHAHYDVALFWDPYCSNSGENGITTIVNANCGFGIAPVRKRDIQRTMQMLETTEQIPVAHQRSALPWDWESFPDYLDRVKVLPKGVNIASYLPLNQLLVYVMGVEESKTRRPTPAEMAEIHRLINEAMDAGAIGISMSAMGEAGNSHLDCDGTPMPTDVIAHDVIVDICRAVIERGEGVIQMLSQIANYGDRTICERVAELAKGTGVRVLHHSFLTSDVLPESIPQDIAWLDDQRRRGRYISVSCMLNRGWIEAGLRQLDVCAGQLKGVRAIARCNSDEEVMELISSDTFRDAFEAEYASAGPCNGASGFEPQIVISVGDDPALAPYLDRTLGEIAQAEGRGVIDVLLDLARRSNLGLQVRTAQITATDPSQAVRMMAHSAIVPGGSDGGAHTKSFGMGHYATDLLIWLVRDEKCMMIEDLHFQFGLKTARTMQIAQRGALLPGYWADILIYDLDKLYSDQRRYEIVHDMPGGDWRRKARAGGYDYILVNGEVTHEQDRPTAATPGHFVGTARERAAGMAMAAE
jgi:N-acyl-D-aspartate/D-glutamate deacylase